jgi:hypothetical protein
MQSVKELTNDISIYGMYKLSVHLPVLAVRDFTDDFLSHGCKWKTIFDLFSFLSLVHSPCVMPPSCSYSRRPPPCSPLPPTALRTARSLWSPCSIFPFSPPLPLPHGSMAGRPLPQRPAEDAWPSPYCHTFSSILKFILHSLVVLHTNGVDRYICFEESLVVYWS